MCRYVVWIVGAVLSIFLCPEVLGQTLIAKGVYRGKNIYVQNPYIPVSKKYCITSIELNGRVVIAAPESSAVQVDLSGLQLDDDVTIIIHHFDECSPKVLNREVLDSGTNFHFVQTLADDASISWVTNGEEPGKAGFIVEKKKMQKWAPVAEVTAKGNLDANQYSIGIEYYSGLNEFRIHYLSADQDQYSDEFSFYSAQDPISFFPVDDVDNLLSLSRSTDYIIKNANGKVVMQGVGMDINVEHLPYGEYTLIIENHEESFYKPEPEKDKQ